MRLKACYRKWIILYWTVIIDSKFIWIYVLTVYYLWLRIYILHHFRLCILCSLQRTHLFCWIKCQNRALANRHTNGIFTSRFSLSEAVDAGKPPPCWAADSVTCTVSCSQWNAVHPLEVQTPAPRTCVVHECAVYLTGHPQAMRNVVSPLLPPIVPR